MSWFSPSRLVPSRLVPSLPPYSGPYPVGSCDVELSAADLPSPGSPPPNAPATIAFRLFYPAAGSGPSRPIRWLPSPQKAHFAAYARFLGAGSLLSTAVSLAPNVLYYTTIPARRNAPLLHPPGPAWPVLVFSHGLAGSRNAYSALLGELASHGIIVVAPEHRDGSAPMAFVRAPDGGASTSVSYQIHPHKPTAEVYAARDAQVRIRGWEIGVLYAALEKIGEGAEMRNLDPNLGVGGVEEDVLGSFVGRLDLRPGRVAWAGHSFGAATVVTVVKSAYYGGEEMGGPFIPARDAGIVRQITKSSVLALLDMWALPLTSPSAEQFFEKQLPAYEPGGAGGKAVLSVLSEAFWRWHGNLNDTKVVLAPRTAVSDDDEKVEQERRGPYIFYPEASAHLSQSDFGILFPWITGRVLKATEPERYLRLNVRAILQVLRENGTVVAGYSPLEGEEPLDGGGEGKKGGDWRILNPEGGVRGWLPVDMEVTSEDRRMSIGEETGGRNDEVRETEVLGDVKL
ncbi:hypothetical protein EJ06DRAFT_507820 [Trichodelitschia bisporula]|uniref:Putative phospholipase n=1 Tax=Trichodelitschia bisporula TaxID=703511 RepID=A0A6G1I0T6_9PEZI|nr:hypothetical protein EJ06DRAFT_507820 [Trichodelitschia bisporula]